MGDSGLEAVLMANRPALLRFLRARGAEADDEDLLQELWIKITATPPTAPIADPLAYLYKMADNMMHDRRRSALRRAARDTAWSEAAHGTVAGSSPEPSIEQTLIARSDLARLEAAIRALGDRTARIFRRFRLDAVGQKSIAAEEGISVSAVEKHLQRAYRTIIAFQSERDAVDSAGPRRPQSEDHENVVR